MRGVAQILLLLLSSNLIGQRPDNLTHYTVEDGLPSSSIHSIYQDTLGYIWLSTTNGVSRFNGYEFENYFLEDTYYDNHIVHIQEEDNGTLYFLSNRDNVFYFSDTQELVVTETIPPGSFKKPVQAIDFQNISDSEVISFLETKVVSASYVDHEGSYWIGLSNDGLFYYPNHTYIKNISYPEYIRDLATYQGQLVLEKPSGIAYRNDSSEQPLPQLKLSGNSGLHFEQNKLFYNEDLIYADAGAFINPSEAVDSFFITKNGQWLYFIGEEKSIYIVNTKEEQYTTISISEIEDPTALGTDASGALWIGTSSGLFQIKDNKLIDHRSTSPFLNQEAIAIGHTERVNLVLITKQSGLVFKMNDSIFSLQAHEHIKRSQPNALHIDDDNKIWVLTRQGVYQISDDNLKTSISFNRKNGLLSSEVNALEIIDDKAYLASQKGLSIVDLQHSDLQQKKSKLVYQYIRLNNEKKHFPSGEITVDPKYDYLTINFVSLNYKSLGQINYKYKIEGIHEDWVLTQDRKVQFTVLPTKGNYLFSVKAQDEIGNWGEAQTLNMEFITPFYKTTWFIVLSVFFIILVLWGIFRIFYLRKLRLQSLKAELLQLESKALQSQMNPHFVFNALNSIQSFITTNNTLSSEVYLAKFSNLLRETLNYSRSNTITLSNEINNIKMYIDLEKMRFGDKLSYQIKVNNITESDLIRIPPMLIQPFVENAIVHGISPKKEPGNILITISMKDGNSENLQVIVKDNGVGRKNKNNNKHKSLGTRIVRKRLSILSRKPTDHVIYTDLIDHKGKVLGTKVELIIPIHA